MGAVWAGAEEPLGQFVHEETQACLRSYRERPELVEQDHNIEQTTVEGGYGRKQLNELIQNAADAMDGISDGRIAVVLTDSTLYCANEGIPLDADAVRTLLLSHSSQKRDDKIGRFGLGFKSVLQVSNSPEIISRTVSMKWDKSWSREAIARVVPQAELYPVLRVARAVDPHSLAQTDDVLRDLMTWATTIVRLPLRGKADWLQNEMERFPGEFLLFSEQIGRLDFDDQTSGTSIRWQAERDGDEVLLSNGTNVETWNIFRANYRVSPEAKRDAGTIAARDEVEMVWAVPLKSRQQKRGFFWNYFPMDSQTTLRGIINAPFKMNEDRHDMLSGAYNEEIIRSLLPRLVSDNLPKLVDPDDPGSVLELLPARYRPVELASWADEILNVPVMTAVASSRCLPDQTGELVSVGDIRVAPQLEDATKLHALWKSTAIAADAWLHPSATSNTSRNAQVNRLLETAKKSRETVTTWLEEVVAGGELQDYALALEIAVEINDRHPDITQAMRQSRIVLASDGTVQKPIVSDVFLAVGDEDNDPKIIAPRLVEFPGVLQLLKRLNFKPLDERGRLEQVLATAASSPNNVDALTSLWKLVRVLPAPEAARAIQEKFPGLSIRVKCMDGRWKPLSTLWISGRLFSASSFTDAEIRVDEVHHRLEMQVLGALGARRELESVRSVSSGPLYSLWRDAQTTAISKASQLEAVQLSGVNLRFPAVRASVGLETLMDATHEVRHRASMQLLRQQHNKASVKVSREFVGDKIVDAPDMWWIKNFGVLQTSLGLVETRYCVGHVDGVSHHLLPIPTDDAAAATLELPTIVPSPLWERIFALAASRLELPQVHALYGMAALSGAPRPAQMKIQCASSSDFMPPSSVVVAADRGTFDHLCRNTELPSVFTTSPEANAALVDCWGLSELSIDFFDELVVVDDGLPQPAIERFEGLPRHVSGTSKLELFPCSLLMRRLTNSRDDVVETTELRYELANGKLYYPSGASDLMLMRIIVEAHGVKKDAKTVLEQLKADRHQRAIQKRIDDAKKLLTDEEKILALVGDDAIRNLVPDYVLDMISGRTDAPLDGKKLFSVASALHGADLIKRISPELEKLGIDTPAQFRGNKDAVQFIKDLELSGFYAGKSDVRKPAREEVVGPVRLDPMHDYQQDVSDQVLRLLAGDGKRRGIIELPTGAGKTRVAVESAVEHVNRTESNQLIVWIAQSEELCEQAIETWMYVWQAMGASGQRMAVSRLWGNNEASGEATKLHLVVATIQKLVSIADRTAKDYGWMQGADIVFVDEAHTATTTSYTKTFQWFGHSHTDRSRPLIGLSATPYRGRSEEQTQLLVNRFDQNLISPSQFDDQSAHAYLQNMRVLANVRHEVLQGMDLKLSDGSSANPDRFVMLESRVDYQAVAVDAARNNNILDHIKKLEDGTTALVFAASVQHAEALAATLTTEGTSASAISGNTPAAERRRLIEDFRSGEVRVLTNFNVLSQGFDAPKVGAVYVCRPTFSPNRYLQMIGRGLRGPLNGGNDEVLIVNVQDNIDLFGERLAFNEFTHLWEKSA